MNNSPFTSFWMGGFECTDQLNAFGNRVDFLNVTGHLRHLESDYQMLQHFNISTVREGIRWSFVEKRPYEYDFSVVGEMIRCGKSHNIQQLWDICHFGYPDDLTPLHPMFARRFAAVCRAFVHFYRSIDPDGTLIVTPINEVSFISWLGGDACGTVPYCNRQGWEVKYALMRAYIEGVAAMREIDPGIKILTTEPLVNVVPALNASIEQINSARTRHDFQYQATDILIGAQCAELGGKPEYLDFVGVNFYYDNQWQNEPWHMLSWKNEPADARWVPLQFLLREVYRRYQKPLVLSETSHPREDRPQWMHMIATETATLIEQGVPLYGVCLYPIIDRPDWDHLLPWHNAGLWDVVPDETGKLNRNLHQPYANALLHGQSLVESAFEKVNKSQFENQFLIADL